MQQGVIIESLVKLSNNAKMQQGYSLWLNLSNIAEKMQQGYKLV